MGCSFVFATKMVKILLIGGNTIEVYTTKDQYGCWLLLLLVVGR